jgi:hypothetical protein
VKKIQRASSPGGNAACGNAAPGHCKEEGTFHHHCCLVLPGADRVAVEGTEGMVAEHVVEAFRTELSTQAEKHRPLELVWFPENPSCIVPQSIREIKTETRKRYIRLAVNVIPRTSVGFTQ